MGECAKMGIVQGVRAEKNAERSKRPMSAGYKGIGFAENISGDSGGKNPGYIGCRCTLNLCRILSVWGV